MGGTTPEILNQSSRASVCATWRALCRSKAAREGTHTSAARPPRPPRASYEALYEQIQVETSEEVLVVRDGHLLSNWHRRAPGMVNQPCPVCRVPAEAVIKVYF